MLKMKIMPFKHIWSVLDVSVNRQPQEVVGEAQLALFSIASTAMWTLLKYHKCWVFSVLFDNNSKCSINVI